MAGEQQRRALLPFLKRAEEVEWVDALVAYYCRMRAAEEGLALDDRAPETTELLGEVLGKLEAAKEGLELEHEADRMHCEGFAMSIFEKADRADRAGAASLGTAKAFYASSVFMEVCRQFGELDADLEAKQKYAVWKASDIRKALKRGERPAPGPPGGEAAAAHEVDELGLPKAPLQGAPLSPSVGIDVEQFTLPTMPRAADESAASYGPQGGQNAAPGEMEDHSRASGPPSTDPAGAAGAPPSTAPPPSAPPVPAPFAPLPSAPRPRRRPGRAPASSPASAT